MSLEAALKENTETLRELIEVLTRTTLADAQGAAAPKKAPKTDKPVAQVATPPAPKAEETKASAVDDKAPGTPEEYAPVKTAILDAIAKGHRNEITKLFSEYGVPKGDQLPASSYEKVLGKIAGIVNGAADDLA